MVTMVIAALLSLLGYAFCADRFLRLGFERALVWVWSSVIVVGYGLVWMQALAWGYQWVWVGGWVCLSLSMGLAYRESGLRGCVAVWTPTAQLYVASLALLYCWTAHLSWQHWDVLHHWGRMSKTLFVHHDFWRAGDNVGFAAYPPGNPLMHYFFYRLAGYSEGLALFVQNAFVMALFLLVLHGWRATRSAQMLCYVLVVLVALMMGYKFRSLYAETVLGAVWGAGLIMYWRSESLWRGCWTLLPLVMLVPLVRIGGFGFAVVMVGLACWMQCLRFQGVSWRSVLASVAPAWLLLPALLIKCSWVSHVAGFGAPKPSVFIAYTWQQVVSVIFPQYLPDAHAHHVWQALWHYALCGSLGRAGMPVLWHWLVVFGVAIAMMVRMSKRALPGGESSKGYLLLHGALLMGLIGYVYTLFLVTLYAHVTDAFQITRFTTPYMTGWAMLIVAQGAACVARCHWRHARRVLPCLAVGVVVGMFAASGMMRQKYQDPAYKFVHIQELRALMHAFSSHMDAAVPADAKVLMVWQGSAGREGMLLGLERSPDGHVQPISLGKKYVARDRWSRDLSDAQFTQLLGKYQVLLLAYTDKMFWQRYGALIDRWAGGHPKVWWHYRLCRLPAFDSVAGQHCRDTWQRAWLFHVHHTAHGLRLVPAKPVDVKKIKTQRGMHAGS